jgi:hypothetical protein
MSELFVAGQGKLFKRAVTRYIFFCSFALVEF